MYDNPGVLQILVFYDMMYLTAIGLTPGDNSTVSSVGSGIRNSWQICPSFQNCFFPLCICESFLWVRKTNFVFTVLIQDTHVQQAVKAIKSVAYIPEVPCTSIQFCILLHSTQTEYYKKVLKWCPNYISKILEPVYSLYPKKINIIRIKERVEKIFFHITVKYVGYSESKHRLRISLTHPRDCHFAHVQ